MWSARPLVSRSYPPGPHNATAQAPTAVEQWRWAFAGQLLGQIAAKTARPFRWDALRKTISTNNDVRHRPFLSRCGFETGLIGIIADKGVADIGKDVTIVPFLGFQKPGQISPVPLKKCESAYQAVVDDHVFESAQNRFHQHL